MLIDQRQKAYLYAYVSILLLSLLAAYLFVIGLCLTLTFLNKICSGRFTQSKQPTERSTFGNNHYAS